jgi:sec-independent protein translocase protein TatA
MLGLHMPELIVVLVIALLIFGPKKLPEMGSSIGKSIKEFRKGMAEMSHPKDEADDENVKKPDVEVTQRELASKSVNSSSDIKKIISDGEVVSQKSSSEVSSTEAKVE